MFNPRVEEDYGFGRAYYNTAEKAQIMYYIVERYEPNFVAPIVDAIIKETDAKTEPERRGAEVHAYTEFLQLLYTNFKPARDVRLIRVLMAIVDVQTAQEALLDNYHSLKGKDAFDSIALKSHIFDGGQVAIKCLNRSLDRMAFHLKTVDNQKDVLGFEEAVSLVLKYLGHVSEDLEQDYQDPNLTRIVRSACRDNAVRLGRAKMHLMDVYCGIEKEAARV